MNYYNYERKRYCRFYKNDRNENRKLIDENDKEIGCMICYSHENN